MAFDRPEAAPEAFVRPYRDDDEAAVVNLLTAALRRSPREGESTRTEVFRWKHFRSPWGRSLMLVGELEGAVVSFRAWLPWRLTAGGEVLHVVRAVDVATSQASRRMGISSRLSEEGNAALRQAGVALVYSTVSASALGIAVRTGARVVGRLPVRVRLHPLRLARRAASRRLPGTAAAPGLEAASVEEVVGDEPGTNALLAEAAAAERRLATARDAPYLRWRYPAAFGYRALSCQSGGQLRGMAIYRLRPRGKLCEATVAEVIGRPGDRRAARQLLHGVARAARGDYLTCHFPPGSAPARAATLQGFVRSPRRVTLIVRDLGALPVPDVEDHRSWALSLGDLEAVL